MFYKEDSVMDSLYCPSCLNVIENCTCFVDWDYPVSLKLVRQSEEVALDSTSKAPAMLTQETTTFADENLGLNVGQACSTDKFSESDAVTTASLTEFLSRPVRLTSFTWNETDLVGATLATINPWYVFFNDARIKYKLNNFAFIRCNLKIKIMINASPFYYGALAMPYQPLPNFTPSTIVTTTVAANYLIPTSQRPLLWIYPQSSQGGEMTLPFFYHKNWLRIGTSQDFTDMGQLTFLPYAVLQSANGVVGTGVTVQVYAWAEDVVLSGSTIGLALQSREVIDEYGTGPISRPATTIAKLADLARNIPVIGKFATATGIGARAISGIASLFGFTNVPVIEDVCPFRNTPFPQLATTQIGYPVEKLTLDPKNELSIDPSIVGVGSDDPLAIDKLVQHESFLTTTTWSTTDLVDRLLFSSAVMPLFYRNNTTGTNAVFDTTPMGTVCQMFAAWRGDIIFRFKVIASPYHKGRLIFSYDPQGDLTQNVYNTTQTAAAVFTQIIDLGDNTDVEIRIPYQQALPFLQMPIFSGGSTPGTLNYWSTNTSNTFAAAEDLFANGHVTLRVLTSLTAPVATAPVSVLVFVRGADNMEFANPTQPPQAYSTFIVQSNEEVSEEMQTTLQAGRSGPLIDPQRYLVNFGECVRSLRTILRRTNLVGVQRDNLAVSAGTVASTFQFGKLPPTVGFDPNGIHTALAPIGLVTKPYNFVQQNPINWILPCFVSYRGSGMWTFNTVSGTGGISNPAESIKVVRLPYVQMDMSESTITGAPAVPTRSGYAQQMTFAARNTSGGASLTNQWTQAGLSVLCPNYNVFKMNSTAPGNASKAPTSGVSYDGSDQDTFELQVSNASTNMTLANVAVEKYWGCGTDFQPLFFLNVPSRYAYPAITPV